MIQARNHLQLYDYFLGQWQISRRIEDGLKHQSSSMQGRVTFHPLTPNLLHYEEKGTMMLNGQTFDVFRHYAYEFFESHLDLYFVRHLAQQQFDPFCQLRFAESGLAATQHPCREDMYRGTFELISENCFKITWLVDGPNKQTKISTCHARQNQFAD